MWTESILSVQWETESNKEEEEEEEQNRSVFQWVSVFDGIFIHTHNEIDKYRNRERERRKKRTPNSFVELEPHFCLWKKVPERKLRMNAQKI